MDGVTTQPHTRLSHGQVKPVVVVVGDPSKAQTVAQLGEKHEEISNNGPYRAYEVTWRGFQFTVCSHGIGAASASICFEELIKLGAKVILRMGTCGTLQPEEVSQGDIVLVNAAVREEGVTALMVPPGFPAVADPLVFEAMRHTAREAAVNIKYGMCLTSDLFYKSPALPSTLDTFAKAKVDVVEMETATLFVVAKVRGVRAGAILVVDGSPLKVDLSAVDPTGEKVAKAKTDVISIILDTAARIASE
eukprot:GHVU01007895.1.p1 GENE.GHVU01007895.1~~GHVU01007895.1.p1  ORF type:complete len:248 (+),score=46.12 GHVU01007895.1:122-865(+)